MGSPSLKSRRLFASLFCLLLINCGSAGGDPAPNIAPVASFTSSINPSVNSLNASFNASSSSDADGSINSYSWDYGDGNIGTGVTSSHLYASAVAILSL